LQGCGQRSRVKLSRTSFSAMSVAHAEPMTAATANNQAPVSPHLVGGASGRIAGSKIPLNAQNPPRRGVQFRARVEAQEVG